MGQILSILWEILSILWEICCLIGIFGNHSSPPVDNSFFDNAGTIRKSRANFFRPPNFFLPVRPCSGVYSDVRMVAKFCKYGHNYSPRKIWSINGFSTVNNRYVDEELGNPFTQIELLRNFNK